MLKARPADVAPQVPSQFIHVCTEQTNHPSTSSSGKIFLIPRAQIHSSTSRVTLADNIMMASQKKLLITAPPLCPLFEQSPRYPIPRPRACSSTSEASTCFQLVDFSTKSVPSGIVPAASQMPHLSFAHQSSVTSKPDVDVSLPPRKRHKPEMNSMAQVKNVTQ